MRNLLLLLLLANILYFIWGLAADKPPEAGVVILDESDLGPPLKLADHPSVTPVSTSSGYDPPSNFTAALGQSCVSIGPFANSADAERTLQDYRGEGMRASVRPTEGQLFVGNWVQIRNVPNRETGDAMIKKLVAGGLTDAYLMSEDDDGLTISLGLFGDASRAEKIELQAESLNLQADVIPRMRDATVFYVDIALPPGKGAGAMIGQYGEDKVLLRGDASCPKTG